jgi:photosystem II stability/assembly factor-like uncharacterized protein
MAPQGIAYFCRFYTCSSGFKLPGADQDPIFRLPQHFASSGLGYAFSRGLLYKTTDSGFSFRRLTVGWAEGSTIRDLQVSPDGRRLIAAIKSPGADTGVWISENGGLSWAHMGDPLSTHIEQLVMSGSTVLALRPNQLACSTDGGYHWARRCSTRS